MSAWEKVVFLSDCEMVDEDTFLCPICGEEYGECPHPGPHMEDEYDYKWEDGVLMARRKASIR